MDPVTFPALPADEYLEVEKWDMWVAKTLLFDAYLSGLLNFFKHLVTNTVTEGINNNIKTFKRQAYGFRDREYFKLKLLCHLHIQRYALTG